MKSIERRVVRRCFSTVFRNLSEDEIPRASTASVAAWDSMAQITLLSVVEEEFVQHLEMEDFEDLVSRYANTTRTLTYFNRRNKAIHVAALPIGEALFPVMKQTKLGTERDGNLSVVVGRSFGGLVLEYAITKRMKEIGDELHEELGKGRTRDVLKLKSLDDFADPGQR